MPPLCVGIGVHHSILRQLRTTFIPESAILERRTNGVLQGNIVVLSKDYSVRSF